MFVWIPRYAYSITSGYHSNTSSGMIDIKFLKSTTNEALDGTTTWDNASGEGNWNIHPVFTSDVELGGWDSELSGIWVAKFEASRSDATLSLVGSSTTVSINPNVKTWIYSTIGNNFSNCLKMLPTSNSHLMKNSEWGAVAYLTQSRYGRNGVEVTINNSSYITGGGDYLNNTNQSTTGNIYGIYDMFGGAMERVAGYITNGQTNITTYGINSGWNELLATAIENPIDKSTRYTTAYPYDLSNTMTANYLKSISKYGDAIYETSESSTSVSSNTAWFSNGSRYSQSTSPFLQRGGDNGTTSGGGIFSFYYTSGYGNVTSSFRPVLVP